MANPWSAEHQQALKDTLEHYKKHGTKPDHCLLCETNDKNNPLSCAWFVMTGSSCTEYGSKYAEKRIRELTAWIKHYEECEVFNG